MDIYISFHKKYLSSIQMSYFIINFITEWIPEEVSHLFHYSLYVSNTFTTLIILYLNI